MSQIVQNIIKKTNSNWYISYSLSHNIPIRLKTFFFYLPLNYYESVSLSFYVQSYFAIP